MFNLAVDSKLRGCDLVNPHVRDQIHGDQILPRAMALQRKTQRPVQFELTERTRSAVLGWNEMANLKREHDLFTIRLAKSPLCLPASMPVFSTGGLRPSDSIRRSMVSVPSY